MGMDGNPVGEGDGAVGRVSEGGEGSDPNPGGLWQCLNAHCRKYRFLYGAVGAVSTIIAFLIAGASVWSAVEANRTSREALQQSKDANEMTQRALKQTDSALVIQSAEFYVRNRPFVNIPIVKYSDFWTDDSGKVYEHSVISYVTNTSEFPAIRMSIWVGIFIGDSLLCGAETFESSVGPSQSMPVTIGVSTADYQRFNASRESKHIKVRCDYSGLIQVPGIRYSTREKFVYYPKAGEFRQDTTSYY